MVLGNREVQTYHELATNRTLNVLGGVRVAWT